MLKWPREFAEDLGVVPREFLRLRTGNLPTQPNSIGHFERLPNGKMWTMPLSWSTVKDRYEALQVKWNELARRLWRTG